jgi:hypothetical protein
MRHTNVLQGYGLRLAIAAAVLSPALLGAQGGTPAPAPASTSPAVGTMAPDFALPGATRYGLLKDPVRLSDYRGQTVVLAFFVQARTRG